eukprot:scaffold141856_cov32-Tisochrysis_lutea.AAC.2
MVPILEPRGQSRPCSRTGCEWTAHPCNRLQALQPSPVGANHPSRPASSTGGVLEACLAARKRPALQNVGQAMSD